MIQLKKHHKLTNHMTTVDIKEQFFYKRQKFLYHIDTFYYTVTLDTNKESWETLNSNKLLSYMILQKSRCDEYNVQIPLFHESPTLSKHHLIMEPHKMASDYKYHIGLEDKFDIFMAGYLKNDTDPVMIVQLRSNYIWINGIDNAIHKSLDVIQDIIAEYLDFDLLEVKENRIDYAFHTNYFKNLLYKFPEKHLVEMQVSRYKVASKIYELNKEGVINDYITFGRRKSNKTFTRIYNKTKEVVQQSYKQFFYYIWFKNNLISAYDRFCYEEMFKRRSMSYEYRARLEYCIQYLDDDLLIQKFKKLIISDNIQSIEAYAKEYTPELTVITNFEIETKRKYYYHFKDLKLNNHYGPLARIQDIMDLEKSIVKDLTQNVIRFIKYDEPGLDSNKSRRENTYWWNRLRQSIQEDFKFHDKNEVQIIKEYTENINLEKNRIMTINKMAGYAAHFSEDEEQDPIGDILDILSNLNDNDIHNFRTKKIKRQNELDRKGIERIQRSNKRVKLIDLETNKVIYMNEGEVSNG